MRASGLGRDLAEAEEMARAVTVFKDHMIRENQLADAQEAERRQEIVFLALDLISGRITEGHALHGWLLRQGATQEDLGWFRDLALDLPIIGINLYPMYSRKLLQNSPRGLRVAMPYASADIIDRLGEMYWRRYRRPLLITETASVGSIARRQATAPT